MLKEKNLLKAMEALDGQDFNPEALKMDTIGELMAELEQARAAYDGQAQLVKDHHKAVYGPMCEKKAELEIRFRIIELKLERVRDVNPTFAAMERLFRKS